MVIQWVFTEKKCTYTIQKEGIYEYLLLFKQFVVLYRITDLGAYYTVMHDRSNERNNNSGFW